MFLSNILENVFKIKKCYFSYGFALYTEETILCDVWSNNHTRLVTINTELKLFFIPKFKTYLTKTHLIPRLSHIHYRVEISRNI